MMLRFLFYFVMLLTLIACSNANNFLIRLDQTEVIVTKANVAQLSVNIDTSLDEPVEIQLLNLPEGISSEKARIPVGQTSTLITFQSDSASQSGRYQIILEAKTSASTQRVQFTLVVQEAQIPEEKSKDFEIEVTPSKAELRRGLSTLLIFKIIRKNGFEGSVEIKPVSIPPGFIIPAVQIEPQNNTATIQFVTDHFTALGNLKLSFLASADENYNIAKKELQINFSVLPLEFDLFLQNTNIPWDAVFSSDGTFFFTERGGQIKRFKNGLLTSLEHNISIYAGFDLQTNPDAAPEPGLMGLALDPDFVNSQHLYVCYSYGVSDTSNQTRVSRLTLKDNRLTNEFTLIEDIPGGESRLGCRLSFGPNEMLYVSTGDGLIDKQAQKLDNYAGKILRINKDGSIPADNPQFNANIPVSAVWAYGLRNPQGLAIHPNGKLYATDHGTSFDDEINEIKKGANYGWPLVTGVNEQAGFEAALKAYTPTLAVAGMTIYDGDAFPEWYGDILFVSLKAGQLRRLELDGDGNIIADHLLINYEYGRLRDVTTDANGYIYIVTSNRDGFQRTDLGYPTEPDDQILVLKP